MCIRDRRKDDIPATVTAIEYDPNRTANIALICYADGEKAYILAPEGLKVGMKLMSCLLYTSNAVACAQVSLSGVDFPIPFDEMAEAMGRVGRSLPFELKETALGGCAATPAGCAVKCRICK